MNILYVTPLWSGIKSFFHEGKERISGMPAFFNVFKSILDDDKIEKVYIILFIYNDTSEIVIPEKYQDKIRVHPYRIKGKLSIYSNTVKAIFKGAGLVRKHNIKSIYGHGTISAIGSIIGKITGVKHFRRIYGTFLYRKVKEGKNILRSNFYEYLAFSLKCDGLIITNDGTHGDKVFQEIGDKATDLHFLLNGINRLPQIPPAIKSIKNMKEPFFSYVARIDRWKRQYLLVEALNIVKNDFKLDLPMTYIAGPIFDKSYLYELEELIVKYNLNDDIEITGPLPRGEANYLLKNALATFSLYDFSNLGNVFLESLSMGSLMVAINEENSLDLISEDCFMKVSGELVQVLAEKIKLIITNPNSFKNTREKAIEFSNTKIGTWNDRVRKEKQIILNV